MAAMEARALKTEYLVNPLGLGTRQPRLSWLCQGGVAQTAYEVEAQATTPCNSLRKANKSYIIL